MSDEVHNAIQARAKAVEQQAEAKYGAEMFRAGISALAAQSVDPEAVTRMIMKPNAADLVMAAGRDAMIKAADNDTAAARQYAELREKERAAHRKLKGR